MKSKLIVMTDPKAWNFTDEATGQFRSGVSAVCFLPNEGVCQSFSNLPPGVERNGVYDCDLGFKQVAGQNGKMGTSLTLTSCAEKGKIIDWSKIIG